MKKKTREKMTYVIAIVMAIIFLLSFIPSILY